MRSWFRGWFNRNTSQKKMESQIPELRLWTSANLLPEKYCAWLAPDEMLPDSVKYIPAKSELLTLYIILFWGFLGIGFSLTFVWPFLDSMQNSVGVFNKIIMSVFFGVTGAIIFGLGFSVINSTKELIQIARMQSAGQVRYGIFLGEDAMLYWRYTPDREYCHLIPRELITNIHLKMKVTPNPASQTINAGRILVLRFDPAKCFHERIELSISWLELPKESVYSTISQWVATIQ